MQKMKVIELSTREGLQDLARFEVVDEETGEPLGRIAVLSDGLEWRAPGMVGGRLMTWRNFSVTITDSDEDRMERLVEDCGLGEGRRARTPVSTDPAPRRWFGRRAGASIAGATF